MEVEVKPFSLLLHKFNRLEEQYNLESKFQIPIDAQWIETKTERLQKCREDFFEFATTYFPQKFPIAFSKYHRQLVHDALRTDKKCRIYSTPRDFGKTTIFRAFKCWIALFGKKHFYGKVSDTLNLAVNDLKLIRFELMNNKRIVTDFGNVIDPHWHAMSNFHILPHEHNPQGTFFESFSTTVTSRGELRDTRLDFLEFDDYEDYSTSINPKISRQKIEIIERDFLPSLTENGAAIWLGSNAQTTCAINILATMPEQERLQQFPNLELHLVPAWNEQTNAPTWNERYQFTNEEEMRESLKVSKSVWLAEYQQTPVSYEGTRFLLKHWLTYETLPDDCKGIIFCDPAMGQTHDFKAAALLLFSPTTLKFYAPTSFCRRCGWEDYFNGIYKMYEQYQKFIKFVGWESNFFQAQFLDFQRLFESTANRPRLPIRKIIVQGKKEWRIEKLEAPYSLGDILFAKDFLATPDGVEAQSQLIGYGESKHKDYPDALASAYIEVWNLARITQSKFPMYISGGESRFKDYN